MKQCNNLTMKLFLQSQLFKGSAIIFIGTITVGFGNYLFNIVISRLMGPEIYGMYASLMALLIIIAVPASAINLAISRYTAKFAVKLEFFKIKYLLSKAYKKILLYGLLAYIIVFFSSVLIKDFLKLPTIIPILFLGALLIISFIGPIFHGALLGLQKFFELSIIGIIGVILKILLAIIFIYLGFQLSGTIFALILSGIIVIIISYHFLKLPKKLKPVEINLAEIKKFIWPSLFLSFGLMSLYNIDIILAKHFFDAQTAGQYSVLSLIGKILFYISATLAAVIFPIVVEKQQKEQKHRHLLIYSCLASIIISVIIIFIYFLFSEQIVNLLFGQQYLEIAQYLGWFGIIMAIYSLIQIISTYYLSLKKTNLIFLLVISAIIEAGLIWFFHNSIWQIIWIMLGVMLCLLISIIIFLSFKPLKSNFSLRKKFEIKL